MNRKGAERQAKANIVQDVGFGGVGSRGSEDGDLDRRGHASKLFSSVLGGIRSRSSRIRVKSW